MTNRDKGTYLQRQRERYSELTTRKERSHLITEVAGFLEVSRGHATRCLNGKSRAGDKRPGPKRVYDAEVLKPLKQLYYLLNQSCSKRLVQALPAWLPFVEKHFGKVSDEVRGKLLAISPASIDRLLKPIKVKRGHGLTKAPDSRWYKAHVPIKPKDWNVKEPGHLQGDTVAHCGDNGTGRFASSLTLSDIDSGWTENRAMITKESSKVRVALEQIELDLPYKIQSIKFDSGSEFMNFGVISFLRSTAIRHQPINIYRSRPYRKNDNCYVEQKNFTHVRELFGYDRVSTQKAVDVMNHIYVNIWGPLQNHFMPQMKLLRKERIGARIKKAYDKAKTPYQRLLESPALNELQKHKLRTQHESLDPVLLKQELEKKLKEFFEEVRMESAGMQNAA